MTNSERTARDVTLVMTILNEENGIGSFMESLSAQTLHPSRIIIVDGGSTDSTLTIIEAWTPPTGIELQVVVLPGVGIAAGRNRGIELATTSRIVVTDAGTQPAPNWLSELLRCWGDADVVSGFFEPQSGSLLATSIATVITPHLKEIDGTRFLPSSRSVGFTTDAWRRAGGYPEWLDYCEDLIFDIAMKNGGATFVFVPSAVVTWEGRTSLRGFAKQYFRYARGDGKASLFAKRHAIRYATYLSGLVLATLAITFSPWIWLPLSVGGVIYLAKFYRRQFRFRTLLQNRIAPAIALLPVIVVLGDVAKMVGYPAGLRWRLERVMTERRTLETVDR